MRTSTRAPIARRRILFAPKHRVNSAPCRRAPGQAYFTALLTGRTGMPSAMVTDAVAVHFSFAFQHVPKPAELLAKFRLLARDKALHEQLARAFGERTPYRS